LSATGVGHGELSGGELRRRVALATVIGTSIEWYDFFIYTTAAALIFPRLFFPEFDPLTGVIASFATYTVGYIARPLGAVVFGHYGDRLGRKRVLVWTLMLMSVATFVVGLMPTYQQIGVGSAFLLGALRFVQGFAVGGEWGGAALLASEHGTEGRRTYQAAFVQVGVPIGLLLSTGVFYGFQLLDDAAFESWGWRVPFLLTSVLMVVGLKIRIAIPETADFEKTRQRGETARFPVVDTLATSWRRIIIGVVAFIAPFVAFYTMTTFMLAYTTTELGYDRSTALVSQIVAAVAEGVAMFVWALLADRYGRKKIFMIGCGIGVVLAPVAFLLIGTGSHAWLYFAVGASLFVTAAVYVVCLPFVTDLFQARVRYTGSSLVFQIVGMIGGGLVPITMTALLGWSGGSFVPAAAILAASYVLGAIAYLIGERATARSAATEWDARLDESTPELAGGGA
jgi:MFS transporter, MHS family, shikimate and dehydroshikimate transport protein